MCLFIQSSQLLGCACLIMLKKGKSKLQIAELLRACSEVDDTIRKDCNAVLEISEDKILFNTEVSDLFKDNTKDYIELNANTTKEKIEYYFTSTMSTVVKDKICNILEENIKF